VESIRRELSEEKFADFLVLNHAEHATTMYKDIFRVPPAHVMRIEPGGSLSQHRYWSLQDVKPVRFRSDQDYADGLRECIDAAVRRQMRSIHPIGCLLSGGLDSSSVAVMAARALAEKNQRLTAYTGTPRQGLHGPVPSGQYADETPYVDAIAKATGTIDVTYVRDDENDDLAELERFFIALDGPVRNPTNLSWMMAILRLARRQGRRVLLGGLHGNSTISWTGWSQAVDHLLRGRWPTALRQWQLYYRLTPHSRWRATRNLLIEPVLPDWLGDWLERRRHPNRRAAWQEHSPIRCDFAIRTGVDARAKAVGHDFLYRLRRDEREKSLLQVDYRGDWCAAEKALTGVEVRDPTADLEVISYCFGVPPDQYLAEGIDRSLIRRAMWGLLPDVVLTNRLHGMQAAGWHEKLQHRRGEIAHEIAALSQSPLARRAIDLARLERAVKDWPISGWQRREVFIEYNLALMRGIAGGRFLRWFESAN
jgi:asparagine synthase (glutamine-hydrolysing)